MTEDTLTEDPLPHAPATRAWLIHIGSSENGFADAGRIWSLEGVSKVRFGRHAGDHIHETGEGSELDLGIPLGWVSSRHAELRVIESANGLDFDLADLGSRNGTHIERQMLADMARLLPGQVFEIGRSFWMVREVAQPDLVPEAFIGLDPAGTCSPATCATQRTLVRLAPTSVTLLVRGETGTGKEITARAVHQLSGRKGPFVAANLAAMGDEWIETLLFGRPDHPGIFAQAQGGTLFLDELGELSPPAQAKLHAVLTDDRLLRLDGDRRPYDVRVICSTLHDVGHMVESGKFRPDLYSRIAGFAAHLLPLRHRREDLGILSKIATARAEPIRIATRAFRRILSHTWPFNVRELHQTLGTATILAGPLGEISRDLLDDILASRRDMPQSPESVSDLRARLVAELARTGGDTTEVARVLNRDLKEIHRWIERFELSPDNFRTLG